jgi:hypothetical protein
MYTYEVDGLVAIIYKDGVKVNEVGPWDVNNPNGPSIWAEQFCEGANNPPPVPEPAPEETPE